MKYPSIEVSHEIFYGPSPFRIPPTLLGRLLHSTIFFSSLLKHNYEKWSQVTISILNFTTCPSVQGCGCEPSSEPGAEPAYTC